MITNHNEKLPNVLITGTPGVGKTSFSMLLIDKLNERIMIDDKYAYINIGKLVNDKHLYKNWNEEFDVPEFDDDMTLDELEPSVMKGGVILDFHTSDFIPEDWVDLVILLRCNNTVLYDRLQERGYNEKKITENITCEIMEVTADEVKESFAKEKIIELKNEKLEDMEKNIDIAMEAIDNAYKLKLNNTNINNDIDIDINTNCQNDNDI